MLMVRAIGSCWWEFLLTEGLALQVEAVGWSSSLKLWIRVMGQRCWPGLELLVRVIGWGYWIEFLI